MNTTPNLFKSLNKSEMRPGILEPGKQYISFLVINNIGYIHILGIFGSEWKTKCLLQLFQF